MDSHFSAYLTGIRLPFERSFGNITPSRIERSSAEKECPTLQWSAGDNFFLLGPRASRPLAVECHSFQGYEAYS